VTAPQGKPRPPVTPPGPPSTTVAAPVPPQTSPPPPPPPTSPPTLPPLTAQAPCQGRPGAPATYHHVLWIWLENHDASSIIGSAQAPYINSLVAACGLATNYAAISHPSLPNYIAATSGSTQNITNDGPPASHPLTVDNLFSQVTAMGGTWRDYAESAPANCSLKDSGSYVVRHDPALYYVPMRTVCATADVPLGTTSAGALVSDLVAGTLPSFAMVVPNVCDDMHAGIALCPKTIVQTGDAWLASVVPQIIAGPDYQAGDTAIFLTFDEGTRGNKANTVATVVISPYTTPGTRSALAFSHYSLLRTTEEMLGITTFLGHAADATTASMRAPFGL
jgi:hypothetical protein